VAAIAAIGEGLVELEWDEDGERLSVAAGGDAANIVVMASRLGARTRFAGRVGHDPLGAWLVSFWEQQGIDVAQVVTDSEAVTGLYLNTDSEDGGHRFSYWRIASAGSRLSPGDLGDCLFDDLGMLVVTGVTIAVSSTSSAAALDAVGRARAAGARIVCVLNHRPALGGDLDALATLASGADLVIGSVEDARAVFDDGDPVSLARNALPVPELVLTAAGEPVVAVIDGRAIEQAVPSMPVVNAGGAGDAFAGAYLARRLSGSSPPESLAWGVAASARTVTRRGCASAYPSLAEVAALVDDLSAPA
jgi:2-dehydro-3-deoxygluconokinase